MFQSLLESNKATQNSKSDSVLSSSFKALTEDDMKNLYFGDFMKSKDETRLYEEIKELNKLKEVIKFYLNLLFFMIKYEYFAKGC